MHLFSINRLPLSRQFFYSGITVLLVASICFALSNLLTYRVVAFILLVTVSLIAITFDIYPVLLAASLSALIWDFFFIPPRFTIHVATTEDAILLVMYFVIALVNAVLTFKIRQAENMAREREEKANAVKLYNTLFNSLSHELKTPIATITGATDNLLAGNESLTPEHKQELTESIAHSAFRLHEQVENLLNMSRLESGILQPKKDWCDITELVYDTVKRVEENGIGQRIRIHINPTLPLIRTDKMMLGQIIYNLLANAVRYTAAGTNIAVSVMLYTDLLQLVIEDNGTGFPEKDIPHVFEKFYLLENAANRGTGLGLSIVKGFTEALNGTVSLQNVATGGARFTISIPVPPSGRNEST